MPNHNLDLIAESCAFIERSGSRWGTKEDMKRSQAETRLDSIFLSFGEAIAAYRFDSNFSVTSFKDAHALLAARVKQLKEFSDQHERKTGKAAFREMWTTVPASDVRQSPPGYIAVGAKGAKDEQILAALVENLNSQNLWLQVSAFEAFEKFYKDFYGALGYLDRNLWRCSDFGDASVDELRKKDMSWHQAQVRKTIARHDIKQILARLRTILPVFAEREAGPDVNLRMWVGIAGAFRHIIVHSRASLPEPDVTAMLEKASGESFTGKKKDVRMRCAIVHLKYLRIADGMCNIEGIDRRQLKPSYAFVNKPTLDLMEKLVSHAALAYSASLMHFDREPFWERNKEAPTR